MNQGAMSQVSRRKRVTLNLGVVSQYQGGNVEEERSCTKMFTKLVIHLCEVEAHDFILHSPNLIL